MAASKKYANLPDLDAAPEIYETPDLADDVSTVQTNTLRTDSAAGSDDSDSGHGLDRHRLDRDEARRRFGPAVVDARAVNFSDSVAGNRKAYITRHRRRRKDAAGLADGSGSESEEETLSQKLARLRRETEEVRMELEGREQDESRDGVAGQQNGGLDGEAGELSRTLERLDVNAKARNGTLEEEFTRNLQNSDLEEDKGPRSMRERVPNNPPMSAIAAFSDRLTALETGLGLSASSSTDASILPRLNSLSSQISTLSSTLAPPRHSASSSTAAPALPHLDALASRIHTLTQESDRLAQSRKAALQALTELHDARLRQTSSSAYSRHHNRTASRPTTAASSHPQQNGVGGEAKEEEEDDPSSREAGLESQLFLSEQSAKITALYQILPTIQNLQPLLPLVLDRLRALSVMHAGAAAAQAELNEISRGQEEMGGEMRKWRAAVEGLEKGIGELKQGMAENVGVIGHMVREIEDKVGALEKRR